MLINSLLNKIELYSQAASLIKLAGVECYHVSRSDLEVGKTYQFDSSMWNTGIPVEEAVVNILEQVRETEFPDKPSRKNSFFCSPFKHSIWLRSDDPSQKLYKVETGDKYHIGDCDLLNEIKQYISDYYSTDDAFKLARDYWSGKNRSPSYNRFKGYEILTPSITVIEKYDNPITSSEKFFTLKKLPPSSRRLNLGQTIMLTKMHRFINEDSKNKDRFFESSKAYYALFICNDNKKIIDAVSYDSEPTLLRDIFSKRFEYLEPID